MSSISAGTTSTTTLVHSGDTTGSLVFKTNDTGSGGTTAVTIDTSQNVGIGTTSPLGVLDVASSSNPAVRIRNTSTGGAGIWFANSTSGTTTSDGSNVGIDSSQQLNLWNYENTATLFATNNTERMRIDSSGNLLVGQTSNNTTWNAGLCLSKDTGTTKWAVGPYSTATNFVISSGAGSGVYLNGTSATSWASASDERLKENLIEIDNGLVKVCALRSVIGNFISDKSKQRKAFLIAQDVQAVLPEAVSIANEEDGYLGVAYTDVIPLLVASIKELKAINDQQAETINALTARVVALEGK